MLRGDRVIAGTAGPLLTLSLLAIPEIGARLTLSLLAIPEIVYLSLLAIPERPIVLATCLFSAHRGGGGERGEPRDTAAVGARPSSTGVELSGGVVTNRSGIICEVHTALKDGLGLAKMLAELA